MPAPSRGLFAAGPIELFAADARGTATKFRQVNRGIASLTDQGTGFLSRSLAAALAVEIRKVIRAGGGKYAASLPEYKESYKSALSRQGGSPTLFNLTGTLLKRITVLNRRYAGGRGSVAGVDDRGSVPHYGWGGFSGRRIKISTYLHAITFGTDTIDPRPIIPMVIEDYVYSLGPRVASSFWSKMTKNWEARISEDYKDRQRFAGSTPQTVPTSPTSNDTGSYISGADFGSGFSIDSGMVEKEMKKADAEMMKTLKEQGYTASEAAEFMKMMKEGQ